MQVVIDEGTLREARALEVAKDELADTVGSVALLFVLKHYEESGLDGVRAFNQEHPVVPETIPDAELESMMNVLIDEMVTFSTGLADLSLSEQEAEMLLNVHTRWYNTNNSEPQEDTTDAI